MPSFEQPPGQSEPQQPQTPEKPVPPENLPIEVKKLDPFVDPEFKAAEPRSLPEKIVERYDDQGVDVSWLKSDDIAILKSFEAQAFSDNKARLQALREMLHQLRVLRDQQEGWDEKTAPQIDLPELHDAPTTRNERASSKKQFDPESKLNALRKKSKGILATLNSLSEDEKAEVGEKLYAELHDDIEKFKEALLEQRRAVAKIIEGVRERIMGSIETVGGKKLNEVVDMFDGVMIHGNPDERKKAQHELSNYGMESNKRANTAMNIFVAAIQMKKSKLPEQELSDFVASSMNEAQLNSDARDRVERTVEKIVDRRKAIGELMAMSDQPEKIFRVCFGRDPVGQVQIIPGPVTIYFRCANLEDYALIHSGAYAQGRDKVTDEERVQANRSGGVAGVASRADAELVGNDFDVYKGAPFPDSDLVNERVRLLDRLDGAITAENASTSGFLSGWTIYRHEEQHAIHNLTGQIHLDRLKERIVAYVQGLKEKESETDTEVAELEREAGERSEHLHQLWKKTKLGKEPAPDIDTALRQMTEAEDETTKKVERLQGWPMIKTLVSRYVEEMIEENGKDEILAYYIEGRLGQAIGEILTKTQQEEGLYDYHAKPWFADAAARRLRESLASYKSADGRADAWTKEAVAEHRKSYLVLLKKAGEAIKALEAAGHSKRAIIDLLTVEPLRNWPAMAARMTNDRDWKKWKQRVLSKADEQQPSL